MKRKNIVLTIRGTWSPKDVLTVLCCSAEEFHTYDGAQDEINTPISGPIKESSWYRRRQIPATAKAHQGMLESARGVARATRGIIASELASNPSFNLVIVGHSLGGGTAAILSTMWSETFPGNKAYVYGPPCVGPIGYEPTGCSDGCDNLNHGGIEIDDNAVSSNLHGFYSSLPSSSSSIVSVVREGDPFSTLSLGHLADISNALAKLCEDSKLREKILKKTRFSSSLNLLFAGRGLGGDGSDNSRRIWSEDYSSITEDSDIRWCLDTMSKLRKESMNAEKFYPPGKILYMRTTGSDQSSLDNNGHYDKSSWRKSYDEALTLSEVPREMFNDLRLHPRMFDLSRHVPQRYERLLNSLLATQIEETVKYSPLKDINSISF